MVSDRAKCLPSPARVPQHQRGYGDPAVYEQLGVSKELLAARRARSRLADEVLAARRRYHS
jgi:hypothetical protein